MKLTIYRIFSFLLIPIAVMFGISILFFLGIALSNPAMLLPLFLLACIVIYSFAALNFLIKGIDGKKQLRRSAKDWLKVNAYASIVFALMIISECFVFIFHPQVMKEALEQAKQTGAQLNMSEADLKTYLTTVSYFLLVYGIVLLIHVLMSLQYVKQYNYLFQKENK